MKLRLATYEDWEMLLKWRNDPETRFNSITQSEINEEEHKTWLKTIISNPDRELYIFEEDNRPVGTIRSDHRQGNTYMLSWTIAPAERGRGYGTKMLTLFLEGRNGKYMAEILESNSSSIKMVVKNNFKLLPTDIPDMPLLYYKHLGKRTDLEIIDEIEQIRAKNNTHWMDAVRLCFELDPVQARVIFRNIKVCDARINELTKELAENE